MAFLFFHFRGFRQPYPQGLLVFKSKMAAGPDTIFGFERRAKNTGKRVSFPDLNILCFRPF